ncbi:hypothetical protein K438DRAFT_1613610, partial [Mycena galopus ATCC 62051]
VGLLNWPSGVDFKCMSRQTTIRNLLTLYNDLKDGTCKWVKLSKKQQEEIEAEFEEMVRSGKRVEKIRQRRSDKGQTPKAEEEGPSSRWKFGIGGGRGRG